MMMSNQHHESTAKGTLQTELKDEDHKGQVVKKPHHRGFTHVFNGDWRLAAVPQKSFQTRLRDLAIFVIESMTTKYGIMIGSNLTQVFPPPLM